MNERDFAMYIGGDKPTPDPVTPIDTGTPAPVANPTNAGTPDPTADLAALAAEVPAPTDGTTPPTPVPTPVPADVPVPQDVPATDAVSGDELQKMLDSLDTGSQAGADTTADIKKTVEEAKASLPEADVETIKKLDEALQKIAELETNKIKDQKTIDVIKSEYEKTLSDKISLEYGTASDSKIASMVNEDPDVKMLIAAKLASGDDAKEKLIQARKAGRENVSGTTIDSLITTKKSAETDALGGGQDAGATAGTPNKSLYL